MAKKKNVAAEGEGGEAEAPKSKKKLIIMVAVFVLIGGMAAKSILLKPKPPTPAQVAAAAELAEAKLHNFCASHNNLPVKPLPVEAEHGEAKKGEGEKDEKDADKHDAATATTVAPEEAPAGPVDSLDPITINLAAGHYLKVGLALQIPAGEDPKEIAKTKNWEAIALKTAIDRLSGQTLDTLSDERQNEEDHIGNEVCLKTEGEVPTVYFTDFVMQ